MHMSNVPYGNSQLTLRSLPKESTGDSRKNVTMYVCVHACMCGVYVYGAVARRIELWAAGKMVKMYVLVYASMRVCVYVCVCIEAECMFEALNVCTTTLHKVYALCGVAQFTKPRSFIRVFHSKRAYASVSVLVARAHMLGCKPYAYFLSTERSFKAF